MEFLRFEAPVADCIAHAEHCLAMHNAEQHMKVNQTLRPIKRIEGVLQNTEPLSVPWFDPSSIRTGLVGGDTGGGPRIWIDTEKGVFYWQLTD